MSLTESVIATAQPVLLAFADRAAATAINDDNASVAIGAFLNRIASLMILIAGPLAFVAILWIAYSLLTNGGKPEGYKIAKSSTLQVIIGFVLLFGAGAIVTLLYRAITAR